MSPPAIAVSIDRVSRPTGFHRVKTLNGQPARTAYRSPTLKHRTLGARALELLILTATRTSETIAAPWDEIDLKKAVWTIPAARTCGWTDLKEAKAMLDTLPR